MATFSELSPGKDLSAAGWLRVARAGASAGMLISYLCVLLGVWLRISNSPLPPGFSDVRELQSALLVMLVALLPSLPAALPNFIALLWMRGAPQKKRLAKAASAAWAGLAAGVLALASFALSIRREGTWEEDWKFLLLVSVFPLAQLVMGIGATKAYKSLPLDPAASGPKAAAAVVVTGLLFIILFAPTLVGAISMWRQCPLREVNTPVGALRTLNTAMITYASTYGAYPPSLKVLGSPAEGSAPGCLAADLVNEFLASGMIAGYVYQYTPGTPYPGKTAADCPRGAENYTIVARPAKYGRCDKRSYFTDESGIIRSTDKDRAPTAKDPPLY